MESSNNKPEKKPVDWKVVRLMMKGNTWGLVLAAIFLVLAVAVSYCGPILVSFTVDYVIGSEKSSLPAFIMNFVENMGGREFLRNNLYICALTLVLLTFVNGLSTFGRRYFTAIASEGIAKTLRDKLYWHLQSVPYDYYKHVSTGDLVQRCTSDVETIRRFISQQLLEILRTLVMVTFACAVMFSLDVRMATVSVVFMPFLTAVSFIYFRYVRKYFTASDEAEGKLSATIQENLTGVRVVRAFGQQNSEVEKFTEINMDFREKTYKLIRLLGIYWGSTDAFGYLQIGLSLFAGIYFCVTEGMTLGTLLIFSTYTAMLTWPVRQLGRVLADLGKATVSLGRLGEIFAQETEKEPGAALTPPIKGEIEFKNVCFGYDTYDDVLKDISFTAKPGQTVAILGSTGSGKTSLVQLLQRLYTCTQGEILVDKVNINDIASGHLRKNIGIVLQEPFLYSRTILENIRIADPASSEAEVHENARMAAVHDVIEKFENGYKTMVGERGVTLSGGQKQRVAIARMLMQKAPIIIFDDSMSAVDTETDAAIRAALRHRRESTTTFIISHRITTLCEADNILVLEHGKLVQQGTHEALLKEEGLYRRIAEIQNMLEDELREEGGEAR